MTTEGKVLFWVNGPTIRAGYDLAKALTDFYSKSGYSFKSAHERDYLRGDGMKMYQFAIVVNLDPTAELNNAMLDLLDRMFAFACGFCAGKNANWECIQ